jgi:spermidine/putrescine transport system permease protein
VAEPRQFLDRRHEPWLTLPSLLWLLLLFAVPAWFVFAFALRPSDPFGGIGAGWTLDTLRSLGNPSYPAILWRTLWLSAVTTAVCLLLATPVAYVTARAPGRWRHLLLLAVVVPFWTSFLVRIFAWKVVLHPDGPLKHALAALWLVPPAASLLYNSGAVLLVMVYTELPFAILPIYAAAEKFDFRLLEAARDLGAGPLRAFWTVFLPGVRRGLLTALLVTLIPALGSYVVPDLVGGPTSEMLGNKIAQRTFADRNLPHASALSALLALAVLVPSALSIALERGRRAAAPQAKP